LSQLLLQWQLLSMPSDGPITVAVAAANDFVLAQLFFWQLLMMP
jgi:hypothetical protein